MMFIDTAVIGRNHKEKRQTPPRLKYLIKKRKDKKRPAVLTFLLYDFNNIFRVKDV